MKKVNKNKKGFTLVEMMLSIAIITMISGLFVALIVAIKDSFYATYNVNDATDYAALYSQALENVIIRDAQNAMTQGWSKAAISYSIDNANSSKFMRSVWNNPANAGAGFSSQTSLFNLQQLKSGNREKWKIYITKFEADATATNTYNYTFVLIDNYYNPNKFMMEYSGSFWVPHMASNVSLTTASAGTFTYYDYDSNNQALTDPAHTHTVNAYSVKLLVG